MKRGNWRCVGLFCFGVGSGLFGGHALGAELASVAAARAAHWTGSYVKHDESVRQLAARGERSTAFTVLQAHRKAAEPRLRALALSLLYEYAARLGVDTASREQLRGELLGVAEDALAPGFARAEAFRVLLNDSWSGRDAWYEKQLVDPTLRHLQDGVWSYRPLLGPLERAPAYWVPRLLPLLTSAGAGRATVADLLAVLSANEKLPARRDVALALLPWLSDRSWVADLGYSPSPRSDYIGSLSRLDLKEAIPGLIHVVETEHNYLAAYAANVLGHYRDARALPALRKGLAEHLTSEWERTAFTQAIAACGGVTPSDGVAALEAYARLASTPAGLERLRQSQVAPDSLLAQGLSLAREDGADDGLVAAVAQRVAALRPREPQVALALETPLFAWEARAAQRHVVARLADTPLDDSLLRRALQRRTALAVSCGPELRALLQRGGSAAGRAAAMLDQPDVIARTLSGADAAATLSLLHAAGVSDRHTLDESEDWQVSASDSNDGSLRLPIAQVGPLLANANPELVTAARTWLNHEGGKLAQAWLRAGGQPGQLVTPTASHYSIGGLTPGMTREATTGATGRNVRISYTRDGRVESVFGPSLRDGDREIFSRSTATAADVRRLLGRPDRESAGHIYGTVGGFFWHYDHAGWVIVLAFSDDSFRLGERAPLFEISLHARSRQPARGTLR